jgi:hypothetical protein
MSANVAAAGAAVQVRLRGPLYAALENWRRSQPEIPPRSDALRQLLELALRPETKERAAEAPSHSA